MNIKPCSVLSDTTVTQTAMMVEELLMQRSTYKALVTKSSRTLSCLIKEGDINFIKKHGVMMKAWFHSFDDVCESYLETLTDDTDITAAESYYDAIYDDYMDQLDSLNYAMDSLTVQAPAVQRILTESPTQQIHHVVSKELIPPSTNDCTSTNCELSLLDLHIDVKLQPQIPIATITKEQQPDLTDCEPPVINKCSPVTLDQSVDGNDTHMQLSTPAPSSHALHTTSDLSFSEPAKHVLLNMDELALSSTDLLEAQTIMHPARDVIFSTPIQLAATTSAYSHLLKAPLKDHLEPKENYTHSQTPRPGRKVKDGTLHIPGKPRPTACLYLSGIT